MKNNSRPCILVERAVRAAYSFKSVTAAAQYLNRHPSTVHRALSGDRGRLTTGERTFIVVDLYPR